MEILLVFVAFTMWWAYRADQDFIRRHDLRDVDKK